MVVVYGCPRAIDRDGLKDRGLLGEGDGGRARNCLGLLK